MKKMPNFFKYLDEQHIISNFNGVLCIGDVHGNLEQFQNAVNYAQKNNMFIVSLGDLVDYGDNSKEIIILASNLVYYQNKMTIVEGNHEKKFAKWVKQSKEGNVRVKIKQALQASIDSFGNDEHAISVFMSLHSNMSNIIRFKNTFFTHGALDYTIIDNPSYSPFAYQLSLFGEVDTTLPPREDGFPNRVFNWVKKIPNEISVFVGHDIRSFDAPVVENNVFFIDTGCSKEERYAENPKKGFLSGAVLDTNGKFVNFVRFDR